MATMCVGYLKIGGDGSCFGDGNCVGAGRHAGTNALVNMSEVFCKGTNTSGAVRSTNQVEIL